MNEKMFEIYERANQALSEGKYQDLLMISENLVSENPHSPYGFQLQILSLLMLSKYEEAIKLISNISGKDNKKEMKEQKSIKDQKLQRIEDFKFELLYSKLQIGKLNEKEDHITEDKDSKWNFLLAQYYYNKGKYTKCLEKYKQIVSEGKEMQVESNYSAALIQTRLYDKAYELWNNNPNPFYTFNASIALAKMGNLPQSLSLLMNIFKDEDKIEQLKLDCELHFLFLIQNSGHSNEIATKLKHKYELLRQIPNIDAESKLIINNNLGVLIGDKKSSKIYKMLKEIVPKQESTHEISSLVNQIIVLIKTNRIEKAKEAYKTLDSKIEEVYDPRVLLLKAYIATVTKEKSSNEMINMIQEFKKSINLGISITSVLIVAQIFLNSKNYEQCAIELSSLLTVFPALCINTLFTSYLLKLISKLNLGSNRSNIIKELLLTIWKNSQELKAPISHLLFLINFSITEFFYDITRSICKYIEKEYKNIPPQAEHFYLLALSNLDIEEASIYAKNIDQLNNDFDSKYIQQLLSDSPYILTSKADLLNKEKEKKEVKKIEKKKKHHKKFPKNFDPKNPPAEKPDPERWLPKWQRAKYRKLAKKKGILYRGAQGDVTATSAQQMASSAGQNVVTSKTKK